MSNCDWHIGNNTDYLLALPSPYSQHWALTFLSLLFLSHCPPEPSKEGRDIECQGLWVSSFSDSPVDLLLVVVWGLKQLLKLLFLLFLHRLLYLLLLQVPDLVMQGQDTPKCRCVLHNRYNLTWTHCSGSFWDSMRQGLLCQRQEFLCFLTLNFSHFCFQALISAPRCSGQWSYRQLLSEPWTAPCPYLPASSHPLLPTCLLNTYWPLV